ncbi:MAG: hypothetical protein JSS71_08805 [Armatimonadetes bacterium]|nr:hypothetical protein [Armatimonadota bacterium]MBX3109636.1 hypothetical protein [Fimbriimonadaceae bacterium]
MATLRELAKLDMAKWQNFNIWRGRLPHWRADDVRYYATFRHKRELTDPERTVLYIKLMRAQRRKFDYLILCVLPEKTEMCFTVNPGPDGEPYELSDVLEKAKRQAGAAIIKRSGERWPPFSGESYDRIIRDEAEFADTWDKILASPVDAELCEDPAEWDTLFVPDAPE